MTGLGIKDFRQYKQALDSHWSLPSGGYSQGWEMHQGMWVMGGRYVLHAQLMFGWVPGGGMILRASGCLGNNGLLTVLSISSQFNILNVDGILSQDSIKCQGVYKKVKHFLAPLCGELALFQALLKCCFFSSSSCSCWWTAASSLIKGKLET